MSKNPTWILWASSCLCLLVPIALALITYRIQLRLGKKHLTVTYLKDKGAGHVSRKWIFDTLENIPKEDKE